MNDPRAAPDRRSDDAAEAILDLDHLGRMTHGDGGLERDVLQLFDRQATAMAGQLRGATAEVAALCAHTLKGSARGIGAWRLARAAERAELAAEASEPDLTPAITQLLKALEEARSAVSRRLHE